MPTAEDLITGLTQAAQQDPNIIGLYLAGSHGNRTADTFSDIDCVAVVRDGTDAQVAQNWRDGLQALCPVVHWQQGGFQGILLNAVTSDWQRVDLITSTADNLKRRYQSDLRPLHDPQGLYGTLPATAPPPTVDPARIHAIACEFLRVLGLLHVVLGRDELVTAVWGAGLQRDNIAALLTLRDGIRNAGGALHQSKTMSRESMDLLKSLPYPRPDRAEVIAAHVRLAQVFFPLAREMAEQHGADWPTEFEAATKAHLTRSFGAELTTGW